MSELTCSTCLELGPEVGLGSAAAEDRAAVLAHVERCPACAASLRAMTEVGDALVGLLPPLDPPAGFERRVLAAIGEIAGVDDGRSFRRRLRSRPVMGAAAALVAAALAVGGWWVGSRTASPSTPTVVRAALVSPHGHAGEVMLVSGPHPWISMTVALADRTGTVRCQVREGDGRVVTLGTFTVAAGYGSWAEPLPGGVSVRGARLTTPGGQVLATADLAS